MEDWKHSISCPLSIQISTRPYFNVRQIWSYSSRNSSLISKEYSDLRAELPESQVALCCSGFPPCLPFPASPLFWHLWENCWLRKKPHMHTVTHVNYQVPPQPWGPTYQFPKCDRGGKFQCSRGAGRENGTLLKLNPRKSWEAGLKTGPREPVQK